MHTSYKSENYNSVSPYLVVKGADKVIEFLTRVFNAVELHRYEGENQRVMHAEIRIDDTVVMLADSNEDWPPVPSHVHIYVKDVDETYRLALEAGATSVQVPQKKQDEDKRGGVKDPGGTTWWIATKVA